MSKIVSYGKQSRYTDLYDEPVDHLLSPIKGYEGFPLVSLMEAIKPISQMFDNLEDQAFVALHNCKNPDEGLTRDESASIMGGAPAKQTVAIASPQII